MQNSYFQKASIISSSNAVTGNVYSYYNNFTHYLSLAETNKKLAAENAMLRAKTIDAYVKVFGNTTIINDTSYSQKYSFVASKVINKSTNKRNNYFTIDKGALHGIESGMGVVTGEGIIGIVKHTSSNFSSIMTVLHKDINISAKIKKNNYFGAITWDGKNARLGQLEDIPVHVQLKVGDTIVTSGFSAIFPKNVPIGVISEFEVPSGKNFFNINVEFLIDYKKVSYAYVIKNLYKEEQLSLEKLNETDD